MWDYCDVPGKIEVKIMNEGAEVVALGDNCFFQGLAPRVEEVVNPEEFLCQLQPV